MADPVGGYVSDYDLLIVVNQERFTDFEYWERVKDVFQRGPLLTLRASPSIIVHSLHDINDQLARGRYFFMDILREGIVLYEAESFPFVAPQPLTQEAAREEREMYFNDWFFNAVERFEIAKTTLSRSYFNNAEEFIDLRQRGMQNARLRNAAFDFHQAQIYGSSSPSLTLRLRMINGIILVSAMTR